MSFCFKGDFCVVGVERGLCSRGGKWRVAGCWLVGPSTFMHECMLSTSYNLCIASQSKRPATHAQMEMRRYDLAGDVLDRALAGTFLIHDYIFYIQFAVCMCMVKPSVCVFVY